MAMMDAEPLFIDTNILIYANVATAPFHEQALNAIKAAHQAERPLWISRQVLREFIAARTRPQTFAQSSTSNVVIERVRYLEERFQVADDTAAVTGQLIKLMEGLPKIKSLRPLKCFTLKRWLAAFMPILFLTAYAHLRNHVGRG